MHYSNIPSFQYSSLCYVGARRLRAPFDDAQGDRLSISSNNH